MSDGSRGPDPGARERSGGPAAERADSHDRHVRETRRGEARQRPFRVGRDDQQQVAVEQGAVRVGVARSRDREHRGSADEREAPRGGRDPPVGRVQPHPREPPADTNLEPVMLEPLAEPPRRPAALRDLGQPRTHEPHGRGRGTGLPPQRERQGRRHRFDFPRAPEHGGGRDLASLRHDRDVFFRRAAERGAWRRGASCHSRGLSIGDGRPPGAPRSSVLRFGRRVVGGLCLCAGRGAVPGGRQRVSGRRLPAVASGNVVSLGRRRIGGRHLSALGARRVVRRGRRRIGGRHLPALAARRLVRPARHAIGRPRTTAVAGPARPGGPSAGGICRPSWGTTPPAAVGMSPAGRARRPTPGGSARGVRQPALGRRGSVGAPPACGARSDETSSSTARSDDAVPRAARSSETDPSTARSDVTAPRGARAGEAGSSDALSGETVGGGLRAHQTGSSSPVASGGAMNQPRARSSAVMAGQSLGLRRRGARRGRGWAGRCAGARGRGRGRRRR